MSIVERAKALLLGSSHQPLRSVSCVYHGGVLRLRGWVPNFYLKQVAQSLLLSMEEAPRVQNELVVGPRKNSIKRLRPRYGGQMWMGFDPRLFDPVSCPAFKKERESC